MNLPNATSPTPLPSVRLGPGCEVSRLMIGSNPMSGFSHFSSERDRAMSQYYTAARTLGLLRRCQELGLRSVLLRGDRLMCRLYRDHCLEGGRLTLVAQTASELADQAAHVKQLAGLAAAVYLHGTWVDNLFHSGREAEVHDLLKRIRDTGKAVGLGTHRPEVIAHAEGAGWDLDFYMACFYNLAKKPKQVVAVQSPAQAAQEEFDPADPPRMTAVIRSTKKPCLAFKVLGAGRRCRSAEEVCAAFKYAYASIKPGDAVVVGVFQQDGDQLAENVATVRRILGLG